MTMRQWLEQRTRPTSRPFTAEQYLQATPRMATFMLLAIGLALWKHTWREVGIAFVVFVVWCVIVPLIIPYQQARWQALSRKRPGGGGTTSSSAGVPLRPVPPSRTASAAKPLPSAEPPAT